MKVIVLILLIIGCYYGAKKVHNNNMQIEVIKYNQEKREEIKKDWGDMTMESFIKLVEGK
jgi:hypothetical protein|tara:strand:- start:7791 stop:7970 length:180 start_codon:yes stop_codon:yes gene_type:complete